MDAGTICALGSTSGVSAPPALLPALGLGAVQRPEASAEKIREELGKHPKHIQITSSKVGKCLALPFGIQVWREVGSANTDKLAFKIIKMDVLWIRVASSSDYNVAPPLHLICPLPPKYLVRDSVL